MKTRFKVLLLSAALGPAATGLVGTGALAGGLDAPPANVAGDLATSRGVVRTVLPNGLTVLTKEVRTAPVVTVQVFYKIGSRNEARGVNGIAHQLEHMLFKGTRARPVQFGRLFNALGSDSNAFTSYDQTGYYGTVEREKAGALLELEADRMRNAVIDPQGLESEKRVVLSEIEGNENSAAYRLARAVQQNAFPNSPYGLTVGGTRADIEKFTAPQVRAYYQQYYSPPYATLVIVGDFDTAEMLAQVRASFGKLGKPGSAPVSVSAPLEGNAAQSTLGSRPGATVRLSGPGATPLVAAVYPLPDVRSPDVAALKVLDFIVLSGRSSRLYQGLVQTGLVADAGTSPNHFARGGWYSVSLTPAPGKTTAEVDAAYRRVMASLRDTPVNAEELNRAKTLIRAYALLGGRSITAQASQLGTDATTANDYAYTDRFLSDIGKVSADDVRRVARAYLTDDKRTVGFFEPSAPGEDAGAGGALTSTRRDYSAGPAVDPAEVARYLPKFAAPGAARVTLPQEVRLRNGLRVFLLRDPSTPTVSLSGAVRAGREFDTTEKAGLADLVAQNLLNGTRTRSADEIANTLDDAGVSLSATNSRYFVDLSGAALARDLPTLVTVLADVLRNPTFPGDELRLTQARALQGIRQREDDPGSVAQRVFQQTLYPAGSPFNPFGTEQSVSRLTRDDLVAFHARHYRPDRTVLTLVGDIDVTRARALLEERLGSWTVAGAAPTVSYPAAPRPQGVVREAPKLPGKTQAVTYLGYPAIARNDPRYYASLVLNAVLGGDTLSSRLGTEIRDRQGLTYGVYSGFQASVQAGPFTVVLQTNPQDSERAVAATLQVVRDVRDRGLTQAEFETARASLLSNYAVALADPDNLASTFTGNAVLGLPLEELTRFQARLNAVTLAEVNRVAKDLLDPDNILVVTAGP